MVILFWCYYQQLVHGCMMHMYLCAHSHVHFCVWEPEDRFQCSSYDIVFHWPGPLQVGSSGLSGSSGNPSVTVSLFWAQNPIPSHPILLCRIWCSNSIPLAFKASAFLMEPFPQTKSLFKPALNGCRTLHLWEAEISMTGLDFLCLTVFSSPPH